MRISGKDPFADFSWGPTSRGQHNHVKWQFSIDKGSIRIAR